MVFIQGFIIIIKMSFYAVRKGRKTGVFNTWEEVHPLVDKFTGASFKKFKTIEEAEEYVNPKSVPRRQRQTRIDAFFKKSDDDGGETAASGSNVIIRRKPKVNTTIKDLVQIRKNQGQSVKYDFLTGEIIVMNAYCDGSTFHNGKPYASGGIGIWFGEDDPNNVSEPYTRNKPTNQRTELYALIRTFRTFNQIAEQNPQNRYEFNVYTDSEYSINCITKWIPQWKKNEWMTRKNKPVKNKELIVELYNEFTKRRFKIHHVRSHTGKTDQHSVGNDHADKLAVNGSKQHPNYKEK
jgi:ribonuclease HI